MVETVKVEIVKNIKGLANRKAWVKGIKADYRRRVKMSEAG